MRRNIFLHQELLISNPRKERILGLDVLRFIAALGVLMYHYFFIGPLQGYWSISNFFLPAFFGEFGVDLFFILSGIVILISAEGRSSKSFILSRILRIYPAFIICSIFTAILAINMPNTSTINIIARLIVSQTFFGDIFDVAPLTSVYWTLMIEVKFYILVSIVIKLNIWKKYKFPILFIWLLIGIVNTFYLKNRFIEILFISKYAGHFCAGILCYISRKKEGSNFMFIGFILSILLIWNNCKSYFSWIKGIYNMNLSDVHILFIALSLIAIVYWTSGVKEMLISNRLVNILGATSYTLYLVHADLGYFIRIKAYEWIIPRLYSLGGFIDENIIVGSAVVISISLAVAIAVYIEPFTRNRMKEIIGMEG